MRIFDISMPIHKNMPVYKNKEDKRPYLQVVRDFSQGVRETKLSIEMHTGTHIDSPLHMLVDGKGISEFSIKDTLTICRVLDFTYLDEVITKNDLEKREIKPGEFILLKTKNSFSDSFNDQFVYLNECGARYLAAQKVRGVGIDSLGIERNQPNHDTHKILFRNNLVVLEGLRLKYINEGHYLLIAVPLNIEGAEASPVRALLIEKDSMCCLWANHI